MLKGSHLATKDLTHFVFLKVAHLLLLIKNFPSVCLEFFNNYFRFSHLFAISQNINKFSTNFREKINAHLSEKQHVFNRYCNQPFST